MIAELHGTGSSDDKAVVLHFDECHFDVFCVFAFFEEFDCDLAGWFLRYLSHLFLFPQMVLTLACRRALRVMNAESKLQSRLGSVNWVFLVAACCRLYFSSILCEIACTVVRFLSIAPYLKRQHWARIAPLYSFLHRTSIRLQIWWLVKKIRLRIRLLWRKYTRNLDKNAFKQT